ncbi:MAG: hypothetical protein ACI9UK_000536 [Candidatus Krumholzibacteriia bacterium]|jgi:hypothetical protein
MKHLLIVLLLFLTVFAASCSDEEGATDRNPVAVSATAADFDMNSVDAKNVVGTEERTPFQESVIKRMSKQAAQGLSVPRVSFVHDSNAGVPLSSLSQAGIQPGQVITVVATTTIEYDNPQQAGKQAWPRLVVEGSVPSQSKGFVKAGDHTELYKEAVARENPGIWQSYEFGQEPRTFTYTETLTITYPEKAQAADKDADDIVVGDTFVGPNVKWAIDEDSCFAGVCAYSFYAGFEFDWAFGIRLPMDVSVTGVTSVLEGSVFNPQSVARGVNWSAGDYAAAGIEEEDGNEFLMEFTFILGLFVEVAEVEVIGIGPNIDIDESSSFTTPFGAGAAFDLPTVDVPLLEADVELASGSMGVAITPQAGSKEVTANWSSTGGANGGGTLRYSGPGVPADLGPLKADDGPGTANVRVDGFKYIFNQFYFELSAYLDIDIFGLYEDRFEIPITDFDLSSLVPDIAVPVHPGSDPTSVRQGIVIENVAPSAVIKVVGDGTVQGARTLFADVGAPVTFRASSTDPGRDDLNLTWDFGDGLPGSRVTTDYPLVAATGPNVVAENRTHTFASACLAGVSLTVTDSDGAKATDGLAMIIRPAEDNRSRQAGYWQHQLQGKGNVEFTAAELACYLQIVSHLSGVFPEQTDAVTVAAAYDVIHLARNSGSGVEKLERELLSAWLNFANGSLDYGDLLDTQGDGIGDMTFADAMAQAESICLDPLATVDDLENARTLVHRLMVQRVGS